MAVPVLVKRIVEAYRLDPGQSAWETFLADPAPELFDLQLVFNELRESYLSPHERTLVWRIEQRRAQLRNRTDAVVYRDFGAGSPKTPRTEQQLTDGVTSERRIADLARASVPEPWGLLLFRLIRHFQPTRLIELGSALGISGAYQTAALKLSNRGHLYTLEGCPQMARLARRTIGLIDPERGTVVRGRFQDTLARVLEHMGRVDFAFVDGHHDEQATIRYWHRIRPKLAPRSVVVFDDIDWSAGMRRAWRRIRREQAASCSIDLGKFGLCLCRDERFASPRHFELHSPQA